MRHRVASSTNRSPANSAHIGEMSSSASIGAVLPGAVLAIESQIRYFAALVALEPVNDLKAR